MFHLLKVTVLLSRQTNQQKGELLPIWLLYWHTWWTVDRGLLRCHWDIRYTSTLWGVTFSVAAVSHTYSISICVCVYSLSCCSVFMLCCSIVGVCFQASEYFGLTDIMKPCLAIYMQSRERKRRKHLLEWYTVNRERCNWTEGCCVWMCEIALQRGEKKTRTRTISTPRQRQETLWELFSRGRR